MAWFKQLCLSWIILSAACVSCQQITSTLREGNRTCPGEEVIFTCTIRGSSILPVLVLGWSSAEYIGQGGSLQLSTANMLGDVEISTGMDGNITATATVTNNTNVNGERILESTLRITAVEPSAVTCSGISGGPASIEFTLSAVPGVSQGISAIEISRPLDTICIILVEWDPPANSDPSDIDQYIIYVPSRSIREVSSSTLTTLTVPNCGDDTRIQVAAVNRVGCVGMNSSEMQLTLLDIPAVPTLGESATTESGSSSGQLGAGAIVGIAIGSSICSVCIIICLCWICSCCIVYCLDSYLDSCFDCCFNCCYDSCCDSCCDHFLDFCERSCLSKRDKRKSTATHETIGDTATAFHEHEVVQLEQPMPEPGVTSLGRRIERDDGSDSDEEVLKVHPNREWNTGAYPLRLYSDGGYQ